MRDGIVIKEHKSWNTKQVWIEGDLIDTYTRVPKNLRFRSPMVNDANQDLCGGWNRPEHRHGAGEIATVQRVLGGLKPFGSAHFMSMVDAAPQIDAVRAAGLPHDVSAGFLISYVTGEPQIRLEVCRSESLADLFDLDAAFADYQNNGLFEHFADDIPLEAPDYAHRPLSSFLRAFDIEHNPPWVTGLVLGYPLENTMSRFYEGVYRTRRRLRV